MSSRENWIILGSMAFIVAIMALIHVGNIAFGIQPQSSSLLAFLLFAGLLAFEFRAGYRNSRSVGESDTAAR